MFGDWDAPITDDAGRIDVPLDMVCMDCQQRFEEDDNGAILPNGFAQHRECSLRSVLGGIGHLVDHQKYCVEQKDPDGGLSYRQSAILVWWKEVVGGEVDDELLARHRETVTE